MPTKQKALVRTPATNTVLPKSLSKKLSPSKVEVGSTASGQTTRSSAFPADGREKKRS